MSRKLRSRPNASAGEEKTCAPRAQGENFKSTPAPLTLESRHVTSARRRAHVMSSSNRAWLSSRAPETALALPLLVVTPIDAAKSHRRTASSPRRHCPSPPSPSRPKNASSRHLSSSSPPPSQHCLLSPSLLPVPAVPLSPKKAPADSFLVVTSPRRRHLSPRRRHLSPRRHLSSSSSPPLCLSLRRRPSLSHVTPASGAENPTAPPPTRGSGPGPAFGSFLRPLPSLPVVAPLSAARRQLPAQGTPQWTSTPLSLQAPAPAPLRDSRFRKLHPPAESTLDTRCVKSYL